MSEVHTRFDTREPVRVLHLLWSLQRGGAELLLLDLLRRYNHECYTHAVCCLGEDGPLRREFEACSLPVYVLGKRRMSEIVRVSLSGRRVVREWKPDIIHIHRNGPDIWGQIVAHVGGVRHVVVTEHSPYTARPESLEGGLGGLRTGLRRVMRRQIGMTIAISEAVKQEALQRRMVNPLAVTVINNGVDTQRFSPAQPRPTDSTVLIGAAGRFVSLKGFDYFIRAAAQVAKRSMGVRFVLAGWGEEEGRLRKLVQDCGLAEFFEFAGEVSDMPSFLRKLDFFVFPSLREGFGLSLVEAMSCGLPCVAADVDGVREIVDSGHDGLLVSPGEVDAIAIALTRYLENREFARRVGVAARTTVLHRFQIEDMVKRYEAVYADLVRH